MSTASTIDITLPSYGTISGTVDTARQVAIFRNVPFAHVPERWRVAVKVQPWSGIRDATTQGPVPPQAPSLTPLAKMVPEKYFQIGTNPNYQFGVEHSEQDGLNMNIFVPLSALKEGAKPIPVLTWIYGGSLRSGSNTIPVYDACNFVNHSIKLNQPVLVVQPNYRLAAFGFLASKELQEDMDEYVRNSPTPIPLYDQSIGNWGLQDQKLAFEWVRENIAALGGDNKNVIAWGESAGSLSVHYHMLIPAHHGLFDHAILQSGTVGTIAAGTIELDGQKTFDTLLTNLDIPLGLSGAEKIKRLRAIPMDELTKAADSATTGLGYKPIHDGGKMIPSAMPIQAWATLPSSYDPNIKSVLIGTNKDEGFTFAMAFGYRNLTTWPGLVQKFAPSPQLLSLFDSIYGVPKTDEDVVKIAADYAGDLIFQYPNEQVVNTLLALSKSREGKFKLERYHYDVETTKISELFPGCGSIHGAELLFVFNPPMAETILTKSELTVAQEMQKRWISFANQDTVFADGKNVARVEKDEAVVWRKDYRVEVGKGRRLSDQAMVFWETVTKFKLAQIQKSLDKSAK
ncbi:MAG: Alpha/Beta hydrolase protein [Linnemannia gamsii]|nr:MAG: Alpha/Beta hydrolase protein [Linnemannia gamsii]